MYLLVWGIAVTPFSPPLTTNSLLLQGIPWQDSKVLVAILYNWYYKCVGINSKKTGNNVQVLLQEVKFHIPVPRIEMCRTGNSQLELK